jgi:hypothetical protein
MTTEDCSDVVKDISQGETDHVRIVRFIFEKNGEARARTAIFLERLKIGREPPPLTKAYLLGKIGNPNPRQVSSYSERPELNDDASVLFRRIRGGMDASRALESIRQFVILSRSLEPTPCPHE